ncbi:Aminodeoxychorismate synthase component 1 [Crateriforma conspicua]|uniref:Aminodeoxychorismate synthase component 1 n=1 Tax=Crateriforma conspicua TaxID=2527996 RepID=A0A5C6FVL9_9PLAN|nr:anthranilate synthase component I family protein [Crateriforma conspicua]TWU65510.1 Aminodeoxychorismate synthase component 1 [Crateriforma conspicua]
MNRRSEHDDVDDGLPIVRRLSERFDTANLFSRFSRLPGCVWFDSATASLDQSPADSPLDRYSFLAAAPVAWLRLDLQIAPPASASNQPDAPASGQPPQGHLEWSRLQHWVDQLPAENLQHDDGIRLPPFQGGIATIIGYEAGASLEPVGVSPHDDLPTPALTAGLYDVVIATDHHANQNWLFSQGFLDDTATRSREQAVRRADQFQRWLETDDHDLARQIADASPVQRIVHKASVSESADRQSADQLPIGQPGNDLSGSPVFGASQNGVDLKSNFDRQGFMTSVAQIVDRICRGDSFQVNLAQRLTTPAVCDSPRLYEKLRTANPATFAGYFDAGDFQVLSSSPEGFLQVRDRLVSTRPIKGTRPRGRTTDEDQTIGNALRHSEKDRAENIMIVDLMRNDLSRVCVDDSVVVDTLCGLEKYQYVQHLVSVVRGRLNPTHGLVDLIRCCFPGGSVTGAPKIEAMRTIAELEPHRRGPYCGSMGYISSQVDADFNILIRTVTATAGTWQLPVGGGMTARSDPVAEWDETWSKAEGMLQAFRDLNDR